MLIKFPLGLYSFNETQYEQINQALFLELAEPEENYVSNATLTSWDVTSMTESSITVHLTFNQSMYLSTGSVITQGLNSLIG
jgi:hypothetical protein